jgi:DNA polymerase-3 subunit gamma/tau
MAGSKPNESPETQAAATNSPERDSSYVVVARRYRPRTFDELVGQEHVGRALSNALETNRVGHAYLFTGARGVGKTSTARIFAKALNNPDGPNAHPDNDSDVARAIDSGEDIDVIEIDGASNRGIDEIRSLRANVGVRPSRSRYKIYIIDEVHMLTQAAFNALLKTLEEPPDHVKFIFCTTDPEKMPITVLSRCQRYDFAPVEVPKIVGRLQQIVAAEHAQADDAALELIARRASGSMRDSQSLLEQVLSFSDGKLTADQVHSMLGTADDDRLHRLAKAMSERDAGAALAQLDAAIDAGVDAGRIGEQLLGYFRDLMAVTVGCEPSLQRHTAASMHAELKQLGDAWGLQTVLAVVGLIDQTLVRIRHSVYGRVLLESTLIQICNLPDLQGITDLAAAAASGQPLNASAKPAAEKKKLAEAEPAASASQASVSQADAAGKTTPPDSPPAAEATRVDPATKSPVPQSKLSHANVKELVQAALKNVQPITASIASMAEAKLVGDAEIQLVFPADASMSMKRMEMPEHRGPISETIEQLVGHPVKLSLAAGAARSKPSQPKVAAPKVGAKERMERMRQIEADPWIQSCIEIFGAEIVKVDPKP